MRLSRPISLPTTNLAKLSPYYGVFIKTAWSALSLFGTVMLAVTLPETWRTLTTVCQTNCTRLQPTELGLATLSRFGLGVEFYAAITLLTNLLVPLSVMTVMGLLLWRKPFHPVVVYLGFGGVAVSLATSLTSYAETHAWFTFPMHVLWVVTGIGHYWGLLTFPDGKFVPSWNRYIAYFLAGASFLVFVPSITHLGNFGETPVNESLWLVTVFTFISLTMRYLRSSDAKTKQQIKWILYCIVVFVVVFVAHLILYDAAPKSWVVRGAPGDLLMMLAMNGLNILFYFCLGMLVYFYSLFDINLVIKRTLVYGGLTLGIALLYVIFIAVAGILTLDYNNLFVSLLATGVIALAFQSLRERLQRGVNRLLYGYRDEPYTVLSQLGQRLESTSQPSSIFPATVQTIAETLKLPYAAIALNQRGILDSYGKVQSKQETFPLTYGEETLGELVVSPRQSEESISKADHRLLSDLARQAGAAAHALLLQADLERSRLRVVSAREEARRRLGNDLHDSVGHQLAGLMRGAETASNLLERDPATARKLLSDLVQSSKGAIEHVRSLAHQLHPPELEVLGLADAIREKVQTFEHSNELKISLEADDLPKLSAAVEVAAYYIVQEALSNVLRHANATLCSVRLKMLNDITLPTLTALATPVLELKISDNGCGLAKAKRNGLGLSSMCERATEVGGTCRIENLARGGVSVLVHLPCPVL
jgi:signal transduction histidine kinase